jgi:magnesium-transporting ATPase (P-type)
MSTSPWTLEEKDLISALETNESGLSEAKANILLQRLGPNSFAGKKKNSDILLFFSQFKSPITLMLLGAALLSIGLGQKTDAIIILCIVLLSSALGFMQERGAANAVFQMLKLLALKARVLRDGNDVKPEDEVDMTFVGFLTFFDPPKPDVVATLQKLNNLGIDFKIITGDNALVAKILCLFLKMEDRIMTGAELSAFSSSTLREKVARVKVFAEVEPHHKEMIIEALQKAGHVVGFMGDEINDATALHTADVGISVDSAVDVAKEAADIVLLTKDLDVLVKGVLQGRITFANTLKYIFMATSANFGNMFSMARASLFLPFLPLFPK